MIDFILHSNRTIVEGEMKNASIFVKSGKIESIEEGLVAYSGIPIIDTADKVLMPGVTDPHVHINEPGRTEWEGFDTATKAAIAGGITTLVDMPLNSSPVTTTVKAFEEKLLAAQNKLHTNIGFWGGIIPGNDSEVEGLIAKGVLGFKAFLTHSGIDEYPNVTEEDLRKVMPIIARHHLPLLVHCELTDNQIPVTQNPQSYQEYLASRPPRWEDNAIALIIRLCEEFNCRVHIVHLSSATSIQQIAEAKAKGLPLTVETAQHYLYFDAEDIPDGNAAFKCAPPIREKANNDLLWQALKDGIIDFVATDHSPAPPDIKELASGDFTTAWGGISSIQFALPILWTAAKQRGCSLLEVSKWLCTNPTLLAGTEKHKGKIAKGYDADFIVFDDLQSFVVSDDIVNHRHKVTPYNGETLVGVVEQTYLAGNKVYDQRMFVLNQGKIILH